MLSPPFGRPFSVKEKKGENGCWRVVRLYFLVGSFCLGFFSLRFFCLAMGLLVTSLGLSIFFVFILVFFVFVFVFRGSPIFFRHRVLSPPKVACESLLGYKSFFFAKSVCLCFLSSE